MAETLELLAEITDGLGKLTGKARNDPLRADEWNGLISGVVQLAQLASLREQTLQEGLATRFAPIEHTHLGQVAASWLAPDLAAVLAKAAAVGDAASRVDAMARQLADANARIAALGATVDKLRASLDLVRDTADDAGRRATGAEGKVNAVTDLDRRVTAIDRKFSSVSDDVKAALAFRDTLKDATGAPIDLNAVIGRVGSLEASREALKAADGNVIRGRDIEARITKLERSALDERTLDARIAERLADPAVLQTAQDAIGVGIETKFNPRLAELEAASRTANDGLAAARTDIAADRTRLDAADARGTALAARLDGMATLPSQLADAQARIGAVEATSRAHDAALAGVPELRTRLGTLETSFAGARVAERLDGLDRGLADATRRLGATETGIADLRTSTVRIATVEQDLAAVRTVAERADTQSRSAAALSQRMDSAEARLADLSPLRDRVAAIERDRDSLVAFQRTTEARLANLPSNSRLDELSGRVSTLETRSAETTRRVDTIDARTTTATNVNTRVSTDTTRVLRPGG
jgi:chromosome segregation ATPase